MRLTRLLNVVTLSRFKKASNFKKVMIDNLVAMADNAAERERERDVTGTAYFSKLFLKSSRRNCNTLFP